jgi:hypothetical protein
MADNIAVTAGTGTNIAADDIGAGLLVQRVKATWGPDGTANDADTATGKPLPIQVRSATGLIPLGEPTDAKNTATDTTSVAVIPLLKQISASVQAPPTQVVTNVKLSDAIAGEYEAVAAGQTAQVIGATGAAGDYLSHVVVSPATAGCGVVTILDNATALVSFPGGGTTALTDLKPFTIFVGMYSTSGAWKITTGSNVSCTAVGNFT